MSNLFDVTGRVAIVTGASSGLGARFARVLAANGARVVLAARRAERLHALVAEFGEGQALAVPTDMTRNGAVAELVDRAVEHYGCLDILVNNAGTAHGGPAESESTEDFRRQVDLNLTAVFVACREAARIMLPRRAGSIINVSSVAAFVSAADRHPLAGYASSKGGVVSLTRELASQWAARGVRVNAIAPGFFPSELTGGLLDQDQVAWIENRAPVGRPGRDGELDGVLLFLASDASSYVVGQTIAVDGGWTLR